MKMQWISAESSCPLWVNMEFFLANEVSIENGKSMEIDQLSSSPCVYRIDPPLRIIHVQYSPENLKIQVKWKGWSFRFQPIPALSWNMICVCMGRKYSTMSTLEFTVPFLAECPEMIFSPSNHVFLMNVWPRRNQFGVSMISAICKINIFSGLVLMQIQSSIYVVSYDNNSPNRHINFWWWIFRDTCGLLFGDSWLPWSKIMDIEELFVVN